MTVVVATTPILLLFQLEQNIIVGKRRFDHPLKHRLKRRIIHEAGEFAEVKPESILEPHEAKKHIAEVLADMYDNGLIQKVHAEIAFGYKGAKALKDPKKVERILEMLEEMSEYSKEEWRQMWKHRIYADMDYVLAGIAISAGVKKIGLQNINTGVIGAAMLAYATMVYEVGKLMDYFAGGWEANANRRGYVAGKTIGLIIGGFGKDEHIRKTKNAAASIKENYRHDKEKHFALGILAGLRNGLDLRRGIWPIYTEENRDLDRIALEGGIFNVRRFKPNRD